MYIQTCIKRSRTQTKPCCHAVLISVRTYLNNHFLKSRLQVPVGSTCIIFKLWVLVLDAWCYRAVAEWPACPSELEFSGKQVPLNYLHSNMEESKLPFKSGYTYSHVKVTTTFKETESESLHVFLVLSWTLKYIPCKMYPFIHPPVVY